VADIALFPLQTVLFPGGQLPLRIFEPRYLDMVSRCLKDGQGFGVCMISDGSETGSARSHTLGTLAQIRDWSSGEDGLLHILAIGERRFRVQAVRTQHDGLNRATVDWIEDEPALPLPDSARPLAQLLRQIVEQVANRDAGTPTAYEDASWVGYRLAELLPISLKQRQYLLELSDAGKRLEILGTLVKSLATG
jgi:Lon protease-like protein